MADENSDHRRGAPRGATLAAAADRAPLAHKGCVAIFTGGLTAVGESRIALDRVKLRVSKKCAALSVLTTRTLAR